MFSNSIKYKKCDMEIPADRMEEIAVEAKNYLSSKRIIATIE